MSTEVTALPGRAAVVAAGAVWTSGWKVWQSEARRHLMHMIGTALTPMPSEAAEYDIFLSYARADNHGNHYADHLVDGLRALYHRRTGRELRVFIDHRELTTAQIWEHEIQNALNHSTVMVAVLSQAYFRSNWCSREWDTFMKASVERSTTYGITPYFKLIFPVALHQPAVTDQDPPEVRRRIREAAALQYVDFAGVAPETGRFDGLLGHLLDDIADALEAYRAVTQAQPAPSENPAMPTASAISPMIMTRRARDRSQFIRVLADAIHVTIIGLTNENLARFLSEALSLKRRRLGPHAFWESLRIVSLREDLLHLVNDQLEAQRPRSGETSRERTMRAQSGKRALVSFLVRQNRPENWSLYSYRFYLPFLGGLFSMADGSSLVQITMARPRHSVSDALYFEFVDPADHYFDEAFRDIVADSVEDNEIVLVGAPYDAAFHVTDRRFRRAALRKDRHTQDWLPSVAVATWSARSGRPMPMLQVRTEGNAAHHIHHLSHIGGYINERDLAADDTDVPRIASLPMLLPPKAAHNAALRELREQLNLAVNGDIMQAAGTCHFHNYDRESLVFHLFTLRLPDVHQFPDDSEIREWTIADLRRLHLNQVLDKAARLLTADQLTSPQRVYAARIIEYQLTLHGETELGSQVVRGIDRPSEQLVSYLQRTADDHRIERIIAGQMTTLRGLAEIHYREFFSTLLPLYNQVGVPGAAAAMAAIEPLRGTRDALSQVYSDTYEMSALPFDA